MRTLWLVTLLLLCHAPSAARAENPFVIFEHRGVIANVDLARGYIRALLVRNLPGGTIVPGRDGVTTVVLDEWVNGVAPAAFQTPAGVRHGLVDRDLRPLIDPRFSRIYPTGGGTFVVWQREAEPGNQYALIERDGSELIPFGRYGFIAATGNDWCVISDTPPTGGNRYGFADSRGQVVAPIQFAGIAAPKRSNGRAFVEYEDGSQAYLDEQAQVVLILPEWLHGNPFSGGLARCVVAQSPPVSGFIDRLGTVRLFPKLGEIGPFAEGLAPYTTGNATTAGHFDVSGDYSPPFDEELIENGGRAPWGFIDETGAIAVEGRYDEVSIVQEGLAVVWRAGKAGYIDRTGREVIEPRFTYATPFHHGLALVREDDQWSFINRKGERLADGSEVGAELWL